jgi:hypothetical protein
MRLETVALLVFGFLQCLRGFGAEALLLSCEAIQDEGKVVRYTVSEENDNLILKKTLGEEEIARTQLPTNQAQVIRGYGGTTLMLRDSGRSGYLLLYSHRAAEEDLVKSDTTLIDINVFQPSLRKLNTEGPRSDFNCTSSRG